MKKSLILATALAGGLLAAPLSAQMAALDAPAAAPVAAEGAASAEAAPAQGKAAKKGVLVANLAGANETAPGDPDGSGKFRARADADAGEFCFTLSVSGIGDVTGAHVHEGSAGKDGKVLMTVYETEGEEECLAPAPELLASILENPGKYYVNVHTADFPKGAIRDQLSLGQ